MASISDRSSNTRQYKYDVFLSFRGEDTRNNFTSHLQKALLEKQIEIFVDDKLNRGDEISSPLLKAIEGSSIAVIIFSKDYASSRWCLEELAEILECRQNHRQIVIPVFYEIDPSHVRNQSGSFAVAFAKHQQRTCKDKVQRWKDALKEAANLSGFDSGVYKNECELIEAIVQHVSNILNDQLPSTDTSSHLVGIHSKIEHIESLLCHRSEQLRVIGLWGMAGVGKSTLVCEVLKHSRQKLWPESALESDHGGNTALHLVCDQDNLDLDKVREVIECQPQLCLMKNKDKRIPLHIAVMRGRDDLVRELLSACPESALESDHGGNTALHLVCDEGNLAMVRLLIKSHPQLCLMKNKDKRTPLHIAVMRDRDDLVSELLSACPESFMLVSAKEETPLHADIRQRQEFFPECWIESIQKRRDYVPSINKKDCAGNRQHFQTIRLLPSDKPSCNGKVDVNALNKGGFTDVSKRLNDQLQSTDTSSHFVGIPSKIKHLESLSFLSEDLKWFESQRNRDQSSHLQANWPIKTKHNTPRDAHHVLLITAAVILAITFYAALIAPGKLVDNIKYKSSSSLGFQVGKQNSNYLLRLFIWFDSIAVITSAVSMIIILMHEIPLKPWMLISVLSIYGAYICLIRAVSPRDALPVFLLGSPTIFLASMSKHLALHTTLLKPLQFLWVRVYKK